MSHISAELLKYVTLCVKKCLSNQDDGGLMSFFAQNRNWFKRMLVCLGHIQPQKEVFGESLTLGSNKVSKKQRVEQTVLSAIIPISKKEIMDILPDVSMTTVEQILGDMIRDGRIKRIGTTRKARYMKNNLSS